MLPRDLAATAAFAGRVWLVPEVREKSRKLVALYVLLAVVVGIASTVGATGDHLLRTIGGVSL
jgi:hypothetical protein